MLLSFHNPARHRGMSALGQVTPFGNGSMSGSNGVENCRDTLQYERPLLRSGSPKAAGLLSPKADIFHDAQGAMSERRMS
jgi:hypothetical protein